MILVNDNRDNPPKQIKKEIKKINHQRKYHSPNGGVDYYINPKFALVKEITFVSEYEPMFDEKVIFYYKTLFGWTKDFSLSMKDFKIMVEDGKDIKGKKYVFKYDDFLFCYDIFLKNDLFTIGRVDLILKSTLNGFINKDNYKQPAL